MWIINDVEMGKMIPKFLKPEDLEYTFAIVVPNLEQPWNLMEHCNKWMEVLKGAVFELSPKMNFKLMERLRERIIDLYKTYEEPEFDKDGKYINKKIKKRLKNNEEDYDGQKDSSKLDDFDVSLMED